METLVAIEGSEKSKLEGTSAIVITCSDSSKQIADPVVYKLARVICNSVSQVFVSAFFSWEEITV